MEIRLQKVRQALIAVLTGVDSKHGKTYRKKSTRMAVKETFYLSSDQVSRVPSGPWEVCSTVDHSVLRIKLHNLVEQIQKHIISKSRTPAKP